MFCTSTFWSVASVQDVLDELDGGADLFAANEDGMFPLHLAAEVSSPQVVGHLLELGVDVNVRVSSQDENRNATPLHMALQCHYSGT